MIPFFSYDPLWLKSHNAQYTVQEIEQQPQLWRNLYQTLTDNSAAWQNFLNPILKQANLQIILCGAGSSAFVGKSIAPWLREHRHLNVYAIASTDIVPTPKQYLDKSKPTLFISYARSGNSPESLAAIKLADQLLTECHHLILTCNPQSKLTDYATNRANVYLLTMPEGSNDRSFAMTSSFSCMALATILLLGNSNLSHAQQNLATLITLCENQASNWQTIIQPIIQQGFNRMIVLGSHCFTGISEEGALKMLELTAGQVATRYDSTMGVRHGPKFFIDEETLVIILLSQEAYCRRYDLDLLNELKHDGRAKKILALSSLPDSNAIELNTTLADIWLIFPYLLFLQLIAVETSLSLGLAPDNPCPTGEVNRVVKGVHIYPYIQPEQ
ncbi:MULTISPECIES: SIS domain-containing protein [unclassified Arsenophonus]|uniref:SIS domain-containing protein n=1 Tax=unclassified Arsenophonus TaxID=2627083 RepID=UPI00285E9966|nr:SIS domain-containing protein [Arsenophonus sp.]MDR5610384.1 SIS domain-containing protein [Arsenophonus sp.]MDR5614170.1 SIS domain-containing protein [Arsenophonus sp.]